MTTQDFSIGGTVRVGFMHLVVRAKVGADYLLTNKAGDKLYCFTPYDGCRAITATEAQSMLDDARIAEQNARADAWMSAQAAARIGVLFA